MRRSDGFLRRFRGLTAGYWFGPERWKARWLTAALIVLTIAQVVAPVLLNLWSERLFDALEQRDMSRFVLMIGALALIILGNMTITTVHLWLKRALQLGWRSWLTHGVLDEWMVEGRQFQITHLPGEHDNPDGRIAEDARITTEYAVDLAHSLFYCLLLLISFTEILWRLSGHAHLTIDGISLDIPGHLVWVAVIYAAVGTTLAILLGRPLVRTVNNRQTREANFRFGLVHARENAESISVLHGEPDERRRFLRLFKALGEAWDGQTHALMHIFLFTSSWTVLSTAVPVMVAAPRYIAGTITLGILMQTAQAFQQMESALSWPIDNLSKVAEWRASVERVLDLLAPLQQLRMRRMHPKGTIEIGQNEAPVLAFRDLCLTNPDGRVLLEGFDCRIFPGERVLITGEPTASVKLFKAVAGVWPWGGGHIDLPARGSAFFMTHRPYFPIGTLREAICYPSPPGTLDDAMLATVLERANLPQLAARLDEQAQWEQALTSGEQQRLGFARILLHRPDWIFLENATDSLRPEVEDAMMRLLDSEFRDAAIVTFSHHAGLAAHHRRVLTLHTGETGRLRVEERRQAAEPSA